MREIFIKEIVYNSNQVIQKDDEIGWEITTSYCIQKRRLRDRPFIDGTEWKPIDKPLTDFNG